MTEFTSIESLLQPVEPMTDHFRAQEQIDGIPYGTIYRNAQAMGKVAGLHIGEKLLLEDRQGRDELTGLMNRSFFIHELESELAQNKKMGVLFIDLTHFKRINDELGHHRGDEILVQIARSLRRSDIWRHVARIGGDEFLVAADLTPRRPEEQLTDEQRITAVVAHLRPVFDRVREQDDIRPLQFDAAIGSAISTAGVSAEELIQAADASMYVIKREQHAISDNDR